MANEVLNKGDYFDPKLVKEIYSKVKGHSTLARLSGQDPIPFNGNKEFIFTMDSDVNIMAEGTKRSAGKVGIEPVVMVPLCVEYGARVSEDFLTASEEEAIDILKAWTDGFAKKLATGFDLMAIHGVNPRTKEKATSIGTNAFDLNDKVIKTKTTVEQTADENLEDAITNLGDADVTGFAFAKGFAGNLGRVQSNGGYIFPEFRFGGNPGAFNGIPCDVNSTVSACGTANCVDEAIVGDFTNAFKWGVAKDVAFEVIPYGNPDNSELGDLKACNQVYLSSKAYLGWGIVDPKAFTVLQRDPTAVASAKAPAKAVSK